MKPRKLGLAIVATAALLCATAETADAGHRLGGFGYGTYYQPYTSYYYAPSYAQPYAPYGVTYDPYPATYYAPTYNYGYNYNYGFTPYGSYYRYPARRSFGFSIGRCGFGFGFSRC